MKELGKLRVNKRKNSVLLSNIFKVSKQHNKGFKE